MSNMGHFSHFHFGVIFTRREKDHWFLHLCLVYEWFMKISFFFNSLFNFIFFLSFSDPRVLSESKPRVHTPSFLSISTYIIWQPILQHILYFLSLGALKLSVNVLIFVYWRDIQYTTPKCVPLVYGLFWTESNQIQQTQEKLFPLP